MHWKAGKHHLDLSKRTLVMGILNVTPDSFSDGGQFHDPEKAVAHALRMVEHGADIIDIGGESSRPGAQPVREKEELKRVLPVIEKLASQVSIPLSIDTYKSAVARQAIHSGASIINDISGLVADLEMAGVAASTGAGLIIMHMLGTPQTMQTSPNYQNVTLEVLEFLRKQMAFAAGKGVKEEQIVVDPGIGFGKNLEHNLQLLKQLLSFKGLNRPLLIGTSRKSFLGKILNETVENRLWGTAASVAWSVLSGARIIRVHDVKEMTQMIRVLEAIKGNDD